jgi:exopolyphosphatase/guanosine-5'-triphosphate,3'-diphosphate pyrophosphatase
MEPIRRAVIDVGTNSIKLLVADVAGSNVLPILEESRQTRLGRGFYQTHRLQPAAIASSVDAVREFAGAARRLGAASIRVIATSAARDAGNATELTGAIQDAAGVNVEIISGEREADWAFQGVTSDPDLAKRPLLLLDVGGGSTEFILGQGEQKHFRRSFALGTVRLMEKLPLSDPPTTEEEAGCRKLLREFLQAEVAPKLLPAINHELELSSSGKRIWLVGTGGTATILARVQARLETFDRGRIEGTVLSIEAVRDQMGRLWSLPLSKRKEITGLPKDRADVILTGVAIYTAVMEEFGFKELRISTRGLRFAAVIDS